MMKISKHVIIFCATVILYGCATAVKGDTDLHTAARRNNTARVAELLAKGADSSLKNDQGDTALHVAVQNKSLASAALLAAQGDALFSQNGKGLTPIDLALERGESFYPAFFNTKTASARDPQGRTVVHYLADAKNTEALSYCIKEGLPLSTKDTAGMTPLGLALASPEDTASAEAAALLILGGADPVGGDTGYFEDAVRARNPTMRMENGITPLHIAAAEGHTGIAAYLAAGGANVNAQNSTGATPLHEAVRFGHGDIAELLIASGAGVNTRDSMGYTPLLLNSKRPEISDEDRMRLSGMLLSAQASPAAKNSHGDTILHLLAESEEDPAFVEMILDAGADVNERNKEGNTPLALAVANRNIPVIPTLVGRGSDVFAADIEGKTPLSKALDRGTELLENLVTPYTVKQRDSQGNTALHLAVSNATDETIRSIPGSSRPDDSALKEVEYLIRSGSDVNSRNKIGDTPLVEAVRNNYKPLGEVLLANGADVFAANSGGQSPLKLAIGNQDEQRDWVLTPEVMASTDGGGNTPLHYAAEWGYQWAARYLAEQGGDINRRNATGETPIFRAAQSNDAQMVELLASLGADVNARDYLGNTPLHACVRWSSHEAAEALIALHADLDAANLVEKTPLGEAARTGRTRLARMLLVAGADPNAGDSKGRTILMDAIQGGDAVTVRLLLDNGASPQIQETGGRTPYHAAVIRGDIDIITMLRQRGGNPMARDAGGNTPLSLAFARGDSAASPAIITTLVGNNANLTDSDGNTAIHIGVTQKVPAEIIETLVNAGCPLNRRNRDGATALTLAVRNRSYDIARLLLQKGADPFVFDNSGSCAVSAALAGDLPVLADIVQYSSGRTDMSGDGILHYAARSADAAMVRKLLGMGLDKSSRNIAGEVPYDVAVRWRNFSAAELLK
ncbi:MAG: ankyrin repeat domain-containing protein [Spirochaetaceae bacterium]|jgi:ankyrin repeat protein|nr:ankyrin repeat domain-containing protein [Spirochaetaceae bacterium]